MSMSSRLLEVRKLGELAATNGELKSQLELLPSRHEGQGGHAICRAICHAMPCAVRSAA